MGREAWPCNVVCDRELRLDRVLCAARAKKAADTGGPSRGWMTRSPVSEGRVALLFAQGGHLSTRARTPIEPSVLFRLGVEPLGRLTPMRVSRMVPPKAGVLRDAFRIYG